MNDDAISGSLARYNSIRVKPNSVSVKLKSLLQNDG